MTIPFEDATISAARRYRLRSERVGEAFQIDVAFPSGAPSSGQRLPVVYVMDGNTVFGIASQALRQMQGAGEARPALVVGVGYWLDGVERPRNANGALRTRDLTPTHDQRYLDVIAAGRGGRPPPVDIRPTGGADALLDFLIDDLRPFIADLYDTDPDDQILAGSSLGGLFSLYGLLTRPGAFRRHVAGSPSLWWNDRLLFGLIDAFAEGRGDAPTDLFLSAGGLETGAPWSIADNMRAFADDLRGCGLPNLRVTSHVFEDETHTSVIPAALSRGLRTVLAP
jgi:predicted alpha/beta superfamily hydrolase